MTDYNPEDHPYPKAFNIDGKPALYPHGHPKAGMMIVFDNAEEEKEFLKSGVNADAKTGRPDTSDYHPDSAASKEAAAKGAY